MYRVTKVGGGEEAEVILTSGDEVFLGRNTHGVRESAVSRSQCRLFVDEEKLLWLQTVLTARNPAFLGDAGALPQGERCLLKDGSTFWLVPRLHAYRVSLWTAEERLPKRAKLEGGFLVDEEVIDLVSDGENEVIVIDDDAQDNANGDAALVEGIGGPPIDMGKFTAQVRTAIELLKPIHVESVSGSLGSRQALPDDLVDPLHEVLVENNTECLYSHQIQARSLIQSGYDVVLTTPTGSGKSIACLLPIFEQILKEPTSTALFLYPLKALAQDQEDKIRVWADSIHSKQIGRPPIVVRTLMGSTQAVTVFGDAREPVNILLMTPDKLHYAMRSMPNFWENWPRFISNLRFVVLDEAHSYRSSFGHNTALLLERLRQCISSVSGKQTVDRLRYFVLTATIGNPAALYSHLSGRRNRFEIVSESGSRTYPRTIVVARPLGGNWDSSTEDKPGPTDESVMKKWVKTCLKNMRVLIFADSVKLVQKMAQAFSGTAYYSSMSVETKKNILSQFSSGQIRRLCSTSALEAGVDFRAVDAIVLKGFAGVNQFHQRLGRCGRNAHGLVVYFPQPFRSPFDSHFTKYPSSLMTYPHQSIFFAAMPVLTRIHILCCIREAGRIDQGRFEEGILESMVAAGELVRVVGDGSFVRNPSYALDNSIHSQVSLRGSVRYPDVQVRTLDGGHLVERVSREQAFQRCFPRAVFTASSAGKQNYYRVLDLKISDVEEDENVCLLDLKYLSYADARGYDIYRPHIVRSVNGLTPREQKRMRLSWSVGGEVLEGTLLLTLGDCVRKEHLIGCFVGRNESLQSIDYTDAGASSRYTLTNCPYLTLEVDQAAQNSLLLLRGRKGLQNTEGNPFLHCLAHVLQKAAPLSFLGEPGDIVECNLESSRSITLTDQSNLGNGMADALFRNVVKLFKAGRALPDECVTCNDMTIKGCISCLLRQGCIEVASGLPFDILRCCVIEEIVDQKMQEYLLGDQENDN